MSAHLRPAGAADAAAIARIWHEGWRDAHLAHAAPELVEIRTPASFDSRTVARLPQTTVAEVDGEVAGFLVVVDDEAEQVYVDRPHRGTGVASDLLAEAERQVRAAGFPRAWLAVAVGNERAYRFYERSGWADEGQFDYQAEGVAGPISVPCRRMVRDLS